MLEKRSTYNLLLVLVALSAMIFINQLAGIFSWQFDFTEEKRYTLHPNVSKMIRELEEPVNIEVFLAGELPNNFKRLQTGINSTLTQFRKEAGSNIQFKFTDPSQAASAQARNQFYRDLMGRGIQPSNVNYSKEGQRIEKLLFPGAIVSYGGRERGVTLLKGNRSATIDEMLNQSVEGLEYELANTIKQLKQSSRKRIGFVTGHNEPDSVELAGFTSAVSENYDLFRLHLPSRRNPITGFDALIIGKPTTAFTEREKYYLDQYIMNGGKLLVFYDALSVDMSQAHGEGTVALPVETNLEDMFFKYGIRLNRDYVADINCGNTPVVTGQVGDQPRIELLPWPYFPIITNFSDHPMVKNLDAIWLRGVSTIDTVKAVGIKKTPLLFSSEYTMKFNPPVRISYNDLQEKLLPERFTGGFQPFAYLLEGQFSSLYQNRFPPAGVDRSTFREKGEPTKILAVADGDLLRNDFNLEDESPLPMGVDPYSQTTYANEDFLMKALDYLLDEDQLLQARNREVKIRPMDRAKIQGPGATLRWFNVFLPLLVIAIAGIIKFYTRSLKYAK